MKLVISIILVLIVEKIDNRPTHLSYQNGEHGEYDEYGLSYRMQFTVNGSIDATFQIPQNQVEYLATQYSKC